ncbi:sulfur carrier protein ThiS [Pseudonocardia spirodelae]|uniref:Sulfur carrier protein ThiS n=1 Tax=Pseudonocardia spirodelae TaxID=3133431 RepID=A0ABU8TAU3_9PSEU
MRIVLNGEHRDVDDGADLAAILAAAGLPERGIAVAVDGEVVPRTAWAQRVPDEGARIEVLTAVQGG